MDFNSVHVQSDDRYGSKVLFSSTMPCPCWQLLLVNFHRFNLSYRMINLVKSVFALFIQLYLGSILTKYTFKMICHKSSHIRLFICAGWSEQSLWWWHTVATWPGYPQSIQERLISISLSAYHMFPRGHFLMKQPVKATWPDNNLFQRIMALLSCYLSVSYRHTCACIQWSYSVDVKKYKFNHFSFLVQWPYYKAAVVYGPQPATRSPRPAARSPQPAARRIVNLSVYWVVL